MSKNWKSSRLIGLFFSVLVLVLVELAVRAAVTLLGANLDIVVAHPNLGQQELDRQIYVNDRYLLWRMKPDMDGRFVSPALAPKGRERPLFRVVTNSRGFQGAGFETAKRAGALRVVCMGNSSTFGWGAPPDSSYPRLLERELEERLARDVEVINAGVPGYSSIQGLAFLEREIIPLSPDILTLSFGANDGHRTARSDAELMKERAGIVGAVQEAMGHSDIYRVLRYAIVSQKVKGELARSERATHHMGRRVLPAEFKAALAQAVLLARNAGIGVVFLELMPSEEEWDPYKRALLMLSGDLGVPVVWSDGLFEEFLENPDESEGIAQDYVRATRQRYSEKAFRAHPDIYVRLDRVHPSVLGHLLIARSLAETVAGELAPADVP